MRRAWLPSTCCATAETSPRPFLYAFDLLELNGADLRREPIEVRKATLASILRKSRQGVRLNEHLEHDCGRVVFQHACKMGLEGIAGPEGEVRFGYYPLHGAPRMYYSAYDCAFVAELAVGIRGAAGKRGVVHFRQYCIGSCDRECPRDANTGHQRC